MQIGAFEDIGDHSCASKYGGFGHAVMPLVGGEITSAMLLRVYNSARALVERLSPEAFSGPAY